MTRSPGREARYAGADALDDAGGLVAHDERRMRRPVEPS